MNLNQLGEFHKCKLAHEIWYNNYNGKINIEISYASKSAIEKVEKAGGTITLIKK